MITKHQEWVRSNEIVIRKDIFEDRISKQKFLKEIKRIFNNADSTKKDTLWYDDNTTLLEEIFLTFDIKDNNFE